jgi:hypothetical protein
MRFPTQGNTAERKNMDQMIMLRPTKEFEAFAQAAVLAQTESSHPEPIDVFVRSLWHAAELDWFQQTGKYQKLRDAGGVPSDEASLYAALIRVCRSLIDAAPTASHSYDEYYRLVAEMAPSQAVR